MNTFKVDGLTRALTRQLDILYVLGFSLGFIGFLSFYQFFLCFLLNREFPIKRGILWEFRDHIKTQASYHPPGPPYTYQGPKFKRST